MYAMHPAKLASATQIDIRYAYQVASSSQRAQPQVAKTWQLL